MWSLKCLIFHRWGKWETYKRHVDARQITTNYRLCAGIEERQRRVCRVCGLVQDKYIKFS